MMLAMVELNVAHVSAMVEGTSCRLFCEVLETLLVWPFALLVNPFMKAGKRESVEKFMIWNFEKKSLEISTWRSEGVDTE